MFWTYETTSGLVLPDSFLGGGSAPRLRYLQLCGILVSPDYRNCSYLPLTSSSSPLSYPSFRVHLTRGGGLWPIRIEQPQRTPA